MESNVIHGLPTGLEVGDVDEDDGTRLGEGAGGFPCLAAAARSQGPGRPAFPGGAALFLGPQHQLAGAAGALRQMEQRVEAVRPTEQGGRLRDLLRPSRRALLLGASGADVRQHRGPRPCLGGWGKGGQEGQALGRSRGGFSTKVHLKTDFDGHPIAFDLTGGEKADAPHFPILLGLGPDIDPRAAVADKGYAGKANRQAARKRGIIPVIPAKANEKDKPVVFAKLLYRGRARIEQAVGRLKRFKRIALRCEKTKHNFASFVALAAAFILLKSVHTA
jgi:transposase